MKCIFLVCHPLFLPHMCLQTSCAGPHTFRPSQRADMPSRRGAGDAARAPTSKCVVADVIDEVFRNLELVLREGGIVVGNL